MSTSSPRFLSTDVKVALIARIERGATVARLSGAARPDNPLASWRPPNRAGAAPECFCTADFKELGAKNRNIRIDLSKTIGFSKIVAARKSPSNALSRAARSAADSLRAIVRAEAGQWLAQQK